MLRALRKSLPFLGSRMGVGNSGFIQLRRGLSEHVRDGRLSFFEASLYVFILMDANPATGLCYGSAGLFSAVYSVSDRTCRDALEKLELKGYLRRFPTRGKHGSYPILINKFLCSSGAMKGKYVNCEKSSSYKSITYDSCDDSVNESAVAGVNEGVNESAGSKILDTGKEKQETKNKKPTAKPKSSRAGGWAQRADGRRSLFMGALESYWKYKNPEIPNMPWFYEEDAELENLLLANMKMTLEQFQNLLNNRVRSEGITHGDRIYLWLKNVTKFKDKINQFKQPLGTGGKKNASVPLGKAEGNLAVLAESLGLTEHQSPTHKDGDLPGREDGQAHPRTIDGDFTAVGHESLPSGDGDFSGKPKGGGRDDTPITW